MNLSELYVAGGVWYMHAVSLPFIANIVFVVVVALQIIQKKDVNMKLLEAGRQAGILALVLGIYGTIAGLFQAFDALENSKDIIPFQVIMGGLKVALITTLYGFIAFCISQLIYIILKLMTPKSLS